MSRPQQWTVEEGVLLLKGLLDIIEKVKTRSEVIKEVSYTLRNIAISKGQVIDDVYRNENGITFQLASMESAYYGRTISKPATKLFLEVVELYKHNQNEFYEILKGVLEMPSSSKNHEEAYMIWLSKKVSPMQLSELYGTYQEIESFCLKVKIINTPIFESIDFLRAKKIKNTIENNKVFRFTHKKSVTKFIAAATHFMQYCKEEAAKAENKTEVITATVDDKVMSNNDIELQRQYPIIYKKVKSIVSENEDIKPTPSEIKSRIGAIARLSDIEYILTHASWGYSISERNEENETNNPKGTAAYFSPLCSRANFNYDRFGDSIKEWDDIIAISEALVKKGKYRDNMLFVIAVNTGLTLESILELTVGHFLNNDKTFKKSLTVEKEKAATNSIEVKGEYTINEDIVSAVYLYLQERTDYSLSDYLFVGESNRSDTRSPLCLHSAIRILSTISNEIGNKINLTARTIRATYEYHFGRIDDENAEEPNKSEPIKLISDILKIEDYLKNNNRHRDLLLFVVGCGLGLATKDLTRLKFKHLLNTDGSIKEQFPVFSNSLEDYNSQFYVTVSEAVKNAIQNYMSKVTVIDFDDYVFKSESRNTTGGSLSTQSINRLVKNAIIEAGVKITPTSLTLKKTFIYHQLLMFHGNAQIKAMMKKALHHRNINQTLAFLCSTEDEFGLNNVDSKEVKPVQRIDDNTYTVNFAETGNYSYTVPVYLSYFDTEKTEFKSWTDLYVQLFACLYEDYPHILKPGMGFSKHASGRTELAIANENVNMFAPKPIDGTNLVIETNISASNMIDKIRFMLELCNVDFENIIIRYKSKKSEVRPKVITPQQSESSPSVVRYNVDERIKKVLRDRFTRGYRIGSGLDLKKFKRCYLEINGCEITDSDEEIIASIKKCCILHEDKLFFPETMLSEEIKAKLLAYIADEFLQGKKALYFEALFKQFSEDFLDYYIYDSEMLKAYLAFYNNGKYHITSAYISKERGIASNPFEDVKEFLIGVGTPSDSDVVCEVLSHIPRKKVMQILGMNSEFIYNGQNQYFHVSVVSLSDEELENISTLIASLVADKGFISGNELYSAIKAKYPYIIENNQSVTMLGMRDTIKYHLQRVFSFSGNVISEKGKNITMWDVFADFAKSKDSFDISELITLADEMNSTIYFDAVYANALRISQAKFVSKNQAQFMITETDMAIARFCSNQFIPVGAINEFGSFPDAGYQWNSYLLAHYVHSYSKEYTLLTAGFNKNTSVGAIVNRTLGVDNFDDFLAIALSEGNCTLNKDEALNFLVNQGYLARRSYSNIEKILIQAKAKRNMKGTD